MNYIPGFSNYLRTSVPRYAIGGRVMDGDPMMYRNEPMFGDEYNMFGSEMMLPPMDQYAQPMMSNMRGYVELPYDTGGGGCMLLPPVEQQYQ